MDFYGPDLAYIHQKGFSGFSLNAAPGIMSLLRRHGVAQGLVIDFGCGGGLLARQLGFAGYEVLGIDVSPAMIRLAEKTAPRAQFMVASATEASLPRCSAVVAIGECFSYAFADDPKGEALLRLLKRVRKAVAPQGVFIFDFATPGREPAGMPRRAHWTGHDWAVLLEAEEDTDAAILTRQITSFRQSGKLYKRTEETHRLRLYSPARMVEIAERAGFSARALRGFGELRFRSGHGAVLATPALTGANGEQRTVRADQRRLTKQSQAPESPARR